MQAQAIALGLAAALCCVATTAPAQVVSVAPHPAVVCVGVVTGAAEQPLYPDDEPLQPNQVGEVGESRPERGAFLQWLSQAELDLKVRQQLSVFGDALTPTVPCVNIDLKPQEKTS